MSADTPKVRGNRDAAGVKFPTAAPNRDVGVAKKLDEALGKLYEAKKLNAALQQLYMPGSSQWHQCESIDDKLHDALALLGD